MTIIVGGFLNSTQRDVEQLWREYKGKFGGQQLPIRPVYQPRNPNDEFGSLSEYRRIKNPEFITGDTYSPYISRGIEGVGDVANADARN